MESTDISTIVCAATIDFMKKTGKSMIHLSYLSKILVNNDEIKGFLKKDQTIVKKGNWIKECLIKDSQQRFRVPSETKIGNEHVVIDEPVKLEKTEITETKIGNEHVFIDEPVKLEKKEISLLEALESIFNDQKIKSRDIASLCFDITKKFPYLRQTYPKKFGVNLVEEVKKSSKFMIKGKTVHYILNDEDGSIEGYSPFNYLEKDMTLPCSIIKDETSLKIKVDIFGFVIKNITSKDRKLTFHISPHLPDPNKDRVYYKPVIENPPSIITFVSPKEYLETINFLVKESYIKVTLNK